ncbi:variant erythrocyte surface antigen-1 family protein [Babesia caballi]|uniref:Variant erythrocyte surface antigen-1 family protein n=1 Tax=Babesia caballi TaxID=5871 RepID=A0AAV4LRY5_BABCB|nr:variant erythrocyte surface antigen-1 family protein [Babesia caballi]
MTQKNLTDCPSNLKEAIDWILRVTGKDQGAGVGVSTSGPQALSSAVFGLLGDVKDSSSELQDKFDEIKDALKTQSSNGLIDALGEGLKGFRNGIKGSPYNSAYNGQSNWDGVFTGDTSVSNDGKAPPKVAAKIFLGCVPMIFYGLSYLYWRCSDKGGWKSMMLKDGQDLNNFMLAMGYADDVVQNTKGSEFASSAFGKFGEFSTAMKASAVSNTAKPYFTFTEELRNRVGECKNDFNKCFLSSLYLAAGAYFRHHQSKKGNEGSKFPKGIRDILYWLSALQFSPQYEGLENHIDSLFLDSPLDVTMTGLSAQKLSSADVKTHLLTTCQYAPVLLGLIQGGGDSTQNGGTAWLHEIFSNSTFSFTYPAGRALFYTLADYVYALHFQLYFLYLQCANYYNNGCGWFWCKYGQGVHSQKKGKNLTSHICAAYTCGGGGCTHESTNVGQCKHEGNNSGTKCGSNNNTPSPLQAFLTDKLESLNIGASNSYSQHMKQHPEDYMCHVKMGFDTENLRKEERKGSELYYALKPFCTSANNPLRQLCEKLICLTRRAPKTLGGMFGFYCQLVQEWDKPSGSPGSVKKAIEGTVEGVLACFSKNGATTALTDAVSKLKGSTQHHSGSHANLSSIQSCNCDTCGKYLYPVTYCPGATFATTFASTYLSWIVDFAQDLQSWLKAFLDEFNALKCVGCGNCGHGSGHTSNDHGESSACKCASMPQCADDLPLFYAYGFQFMSANTLKNGGNGAGPRKCHQFADQLKAVLSDKDGTPLWDLIVSIENFVYYIRLPFLLLAVSFWTLAAITLLYRYLFKLDLLHIKSHLHLPSSHKILPSALLTENKASALKKLFHYMP